MQRQKRRLERSLAGAARWPQGDRHRAARGRLAAIEHGLAVARAAWRSVREGHTELQRARREHGASLAFFTRVSDPVADRWVDLVLVKRLAMSEAVMRQQARVERMLARARRRMQMSRTPGTSTSRRPPEQPVTTPVPSEPPEPSSPFDDVHDLIPVEPRSPVTDPFSTHGLLLSSTPTRPPVLESLWL